ncbi:ATP-binding cassette domain-containing protein [Candidatus Latescibacterota bacterium]
MIEVKNLSKYYGSKMALDNISFIIREGEVLGFLGPNGAGKSTAMKIITCFLSATEGTVLVDNNDVFEHSLEVRKLIGYLPEHPPLYLDMTVKDYLRFVATIRGVKKKNVDDRVKTVVEKCGIHKYYTSYCNSLSKGYRQRVGIAQAMVHEPKYLILDEPTIGLDPIQIVEIRNLIKTFGDDHTVILSTHILPEVDVTCERVLIINEGRVVAEDTTVNLHDNIHQSGELLIEYRGTSADVLKKFEDLDGVVSVQNESESNETTVLKITTRPGYDIRPSVAQIIIGEQLDLLEMKLLTMTLEDIFVKVTMH